MHRFPRPGGTQTEATPRVDRDKSEFLAIGLVAPPEHLNLWSGLLHNTTCHLSNRLIANVFGLNGNDSHENPFASTHGEKPLPCHRSACASVLAPNSRPGTVSRELQRPACRPRPATISPLSHPHHLA